MSQLDVRLPFIYRRNLPPRKWKTQQVCEGRSSLGTPFSGSITFFFFFLWALLLGSPPPEKQREFLPLPQVRILSVGLLRKLQAVSVSSPSKTFFSPPKKIFVLRRIVFFFFPPRVLPPPPPRSRATDGGKLPFLPTAGPPSCHGTESYGGVSLPVRPFPPARRKQLSRRCD